MPRRRRVLADLAAAAGFHIRTNGIAGPGPTLFARVLRDRSSE